MANNLKREILAGEEVVVFGQYLGPGVDPVFICEDGFGMQHETFGNAIMGKWKASGKEDRIEGFWIDKKATEKHQSENNPA